MNVKIENRIRKGPNAPMHFAKSDTKFLIYYNIYEQRETISYRRAIDSASKLPVAHTMASSQAMLSLLDRILWEREVPSM